MKSNGLSRERSGRRSAAPSAWGEWGARGASAREDTRSGLDADDDVEGASHVSQRDLCDLRTARGLRHQHNPSDDHS